MVIRSVHAPVPVDAGSGMRRFAGAVLMGGFVVGFEAAARTIELVRRLRGHEPTIHG